MLSYFSRIQLFATLCTVALQALLSMGFSRQECWSEFPCPPPGDLPNLGIDPTVLRSPALASTFFTTSTSWEAPLPALFSFPVSMSFSTKNSNKLQWPYYLPNEALTLIRSSRIVKIHIPSMLLGGHAQV